MPKSSKLKRKYMATAKNMNEKLRMKRQALQPIENNPTQLSITDTNYRMAIDLHTQQENADKCQNVISERRELEDDSQTGLNFSEKEIEISLENENKEKVIGRRIIHVTHFFAKIQEISNHGPLGCSISDLLLTGEKKNGLISKFTFKCRMCNLTFVIANDNSDEDLNVNSCAVAGTLATGNGHSQLEEFLSSLNLPVISGDIYRTHHALVSKHWESVALESMQQAAAKERQFARNEGRVNKDGIPIIDVIVDGCWSKRSYKKNYSALSGAATIIGKLTNEILHLGIKNKYCQICARAENLKQEPKNHVCFKNYDGSSTGMESTIIVEGFKASIELNGLIYGRLISDGDASTYAKIIESRPYADVTVEKIECRNHVMRNLCNNLQHLATDTKYPLIYRKLITKKRILSIRFVISKTIKKHKTNSDVQLLFEDILLSHLHSFGNHIKCSQYFCDKTGLVEDVPQDFYVSSLWQRICYLVHGVAAHSRSLIHDVDSNLVESYHNIVAKLVGGKRINFSKRNSYQTRCYAAAVGFNKKRTLSLLYKSISGKSPKGKIKRLETQRINKLILNKQNRKPKNRCFITKAKNDVNYGQDCLKPDLPESVFQNLKDAFLCNLNKTDEERNAIEKCTVLQAESGEWLELRRSLLTASNFGTIIKKRLDTSCANMVKSLLYKPNIAHVPSIKHGRENEKIAVSQLEKQEKIKTKPCGLFIDTEIPYLGATPDRLYGEDMIIEIKCPITAFKMGIEESIAQKKVTFWKINKNGTQEINKTHSWYYQVQGQLHITKRSKCLFAVWYSDKHPLKTEIIVKDDTFWSQNMEKKLCSFYMDCLLPELVDPRHPRHLPIRNPLYIEEAIRKKEEKKREKLIVVQQEKEDLNNSNDDMTNESDISVFERTNIEKPSCSRYLNFNDL